MNYLITDGFSYNEESLKKCGNISFDKLYVCGYDSGKATELMKVVNCINVKQSAKIEEIMASLIKIANEHALQSGVWFMLEKENIELVGKMIESNLIVIPESMEVQFVDIVYKAKNETKPSKEDTSTVISNQTVEKETNTEAENNDNRDKTKNPKTFSRKRIRAIKDIVGETKLKWQGRRIPDEVIAVMTRIFEDEGNYTNAEICTATKLSSDFVANIKRKIKNAKQNNETEATVTPVVAVNEEESVPVKKRTVKKDATALAREERLRELKALGESFTPEFTEDGKTLTVESHERFRELFINPQRNWRVSEIADVTELKKSQIDRLLNNEPSKQEETPSTSILLEREANAYRDKMDYSMVDADRSSGIFPSGNIIQDAANALGIESFSKDDENCLIIAFGKLGDFDTGFLNELSKGNFSHMEDVQKLKGVCQSFKKIRYNIVLRSKERR